MSDEIGSSVGASKKASSFIISSGSFLCSLKSAKPHSYLLCCVFDLSHPSTWRPLPHPYKLVWVVSFASISSFEFPHFAYWNACFLMLLLWLLELDFHHKLGFDSNKSEWDLEKMMMIGEGYSSALWSEETIFDWRLMGILRAGGFEMLVFYIVYMMLTTYLSICFFDLTIKWPPYLSCLLELLDWICTLIVFQFHTYSLIYRFWLWSCIFSQGAITLPLHKVHDFIFQL